MAAGSINIFKRFSLHFFLYLRWGKIIVCLFCWFCVWFLNEIQQNLLKKKEIINLLRHYKIVFPPFAIEEHMRVQLVISDNLKPNDSGYLTYLFNQTVGHPFRLGFSYHLCCKYLKSTPNDRFMSNISWLFLPQDC